MSLIRDIMRMDIDPPPVEQPKHFRYRGELRHPMTNKFDRDVCIKTSEDSRWWSLLADVNEVVRYNDNLYVWTEKEWTDFHPGPCTDYDGPRPGGSYVRRYSEWVRESTSQGILNSNDPFSRMIQKKADELMKHLGIGYENDAPNEIERNENTVLAKYNLKYIGETDTNIKDNSKSLVVQIIHRTGTAIGIRTVASQIGFVVSYKDVEYVYTGSETGWVAINDYRKEETEMPVRYDRIYPRLAIKKVIFNAPATIVFWDDGTKTVVKCENEEYDPEKGLAMAVAKKALGNQGNYYNQFKKWLPEKEEGPTVIIPDIGGPLHEAAKKLAEGVNNALSGLKKDSE